MPRWRTCPELLSYNNFRFVPQRRVVAGQSHGADVAQWPVVGVVVSSDERAVHLHADQDTSHLHLDRHPLASGRLTARTPPGDGRTQKHLSVAQVASLVARITVVVPVGWSQHAHTLRRAGGRTVVLH